MNIPQSLAAALRPVTVIVGHYGTGKTNFCMNLALDAAAGGRNVTVIDLDVVNPYFRASEQRALLEHHGVRLVAPVFAESGTSLDVPSLTGQIGPAIQMADDDDLVIIDAGGDDVGATALGRYARGILQKEHAVLYVANAFRNLVQDPTNALENLREIEMASHLQVDAVVNNSHLKAATTSDTVEQGIAYAQELAELAQLPLVCTTVPSGVNAPEVGDAYTVQAHVRNPWE